jgi:hypothetical protein
MWFMLFYHRFCILFLEVTKQRLCFLFMEVTIGQLYFEMHCMWLSSEVLFCIK